MATDLTDERDPAAARHERLSIALRRVVLLRETGPKSAAWHRARVQTIWHLHQLLAAPPEADRPGPADEADRP